MSTDIEIIRAYSALSKKLEEAGLTASIEGELVRIADDVCVVAYFEEFKVADAFVAGFLVGRKRRGPNK